MKYTNRADLLIAAGESIKMQEKAGCVPKCKIHGHLYLISGVTIDVHDIVGFEFPLAVVEGKPVFVGDELWSKPNKFKFKAMLLDDSCKDFLHNGKTGCFIYDCSWNPPKPKTVMVELLVEDAELLESECRDKLPCIPRIRTAAACRKALENLK